MFGFKSNLTIKVQETHNPYYKYAKPYQVTEDDGWTVYFIGSDGPDYIYGDAFSDWIYGNGGNDGLVGGGGRDFMYGGEGRDTFIGGPGADEMFGEGGDDFFFGELDGNIINGGDGFDTVSYFGMDKGVSVFLSLGFAQETDAPWAFDLITFVEEVIGTSHDDVIAGSAVLSGDRLIGGAGNDVLSGNAGTDVLNGGYGGDELTGGADSDTFVFNLNDSNGPLSSFDTIKDFDFDDDVMEFQVYDPNATAWSATQGSVEGQSGTWVTVTEVDENLAPTKTLYEVFLEGTAPATVTDEDVLFV
ncbi:MAG: hypothetical protein AAGF59_06185 [Pseudomonadota bacterium]